jgi:dienelactone hydrolase
MRGAVVVALLMVSGCASAVSEAILPVPVPVVAAGPTPLSVAPAPAIWYSEQVRVSGELYRPSDGRFAGPRPAVVLAPGWGRTAESLREYADALARQGIIALIIDYRGQGASGGRIYLAENIAFYDAFRFSEHDALVAIRRGLLDPEAQIQDIRNAATFLQSEAGVDPAKIAVMGADVAGGHVLSVMGMDARFSVGVALDPIVAGHDEPPMAYEPDPATLMEMVWLAREGRPPLTEKEARERNDMESRLLLRQYKPFWRISGIPPEARVGVFVDRRNGGGEAAGARAALEALGSRGSEVAVDDGETRHEAAARFVAARMRESAP